MAFENSPEFGKTKKRPDVVDWLFRHRHMVLLISAVVLGFLIAGLATALIGNQQSGTGGLDGCLVSPAAEPLEAMIKISGQTAETQSDGCFFFASLPAGEADVTLYLDAGNVVKYPVTIYAGQATMLGTITVSQ